MQDVLLSYMVTLTMTDPEHPPVASVSARCHLSGLLILHDMWFAQVRHNLQSQFLHHMHKLWCDPNDGLLHEQQLPNNVRMVLAPSSSSACQL